MGNIKENSRQPKEEKIKCHRILWLIGMFLMLSAYTYGQSPKRIITLSSAITETVFALGLGSNIVAADVTSVSPAQAKALPKVSRNRSVSAEGIASYRPQLVLAPEGDLSRETIIHLKSVGIKVVPIKQEYTVKGSLAFIRQIATAIGLKEKGELVAKRTEKEIADALRMIKADKGSLPKVLFIYARGTGTMSVAGKGSSIDAIIGLAGGRNAIQEFNEFKPYSTEAMVKANPDVILLFDFGLTSLGGKEEMLTMPGVEFTNAGKNKKIITMDGPLLINFSVRLPQAVTELNRKLR
ncbi:MULTISPECIES: hemin ABC transporter substrate-binding protein [unclassified Pedobacter]|uniref:heme/hemin ABC transporter substrate-binding protein n=1 Tax=unclassified Pedobacter TaxID=2628915 RepID=UPI002035938B|nr:MULTISPECIES: ABC transporter substrate-binding protein [unclassified Pedobacter]